VQLIETKGRRVVIINLQSITKAMQVGGVSGPMQGATSNPGGTRGISVRWI
jgi:hypothetical protein